LQCGSEDELELDVEDWLELLLFWVEIKDELLESGLELRIIELEDKIGDDDKTWLDELELGKTLDDLLEDELELFELEETAEDITEELFLELDELEIGNCCELDDFELDELLGRFWEEVTKELELTGGEDWIELVFEELGELWTTELLDDWGLELDIMLRIELLNELKELELNWLLEDFELELEVLDELIVELIRLDELEVATGVIILTLNVKDVLTLGNAVAKRLLAANLDDAKVGTNVVVGIIELEYAIADSSLILAVKLSVPVDPELEIYFIWFVPVILVALPLVPLLTELKTISSESESVSWNIDVVEPELETELIKDWIGRLLVILRLIGLPVASMSNLVLWLTKEGITIYLDLVATHDPLTTSPLGVIIKVALLAAGFNITELLAIVGVVGTTAPEEMLQYEYPGLFMIWISADAWTLLLLYRLNKKNEKARVTSVKLATLLKLTLDKKDELFSL
jgi:hypothetical protein